MTMRCALTPWITTIAFAVVITVETPCGADDREARNALREAGLTERNGRWELAEEQLLRRRLAQLEQRHVEILTVRKTLQTFIQDNRARWAQIRGRVEMLERTLKSLGTDSKKRKPIESQLAQLRRTAAPPSQLGAMPRVRSLVKTLLTWELEATVKCTWSETALNQIRETYPKLRADPRLARHLRMVKGQLGDGGTLRDADDVLASCREQLMSARSSMYQESNHWRVGLIINEKTPTTVSWIAKGEHFLLAPSLAATVALRNDPERQSQRLAVAAKRTAQVRPVIIERLRMGSVMIENVPAWVLPAEAEDLGTRLGEYSIEQWRVQPQPAALQATVYRVRQ